MGAGRGRHRGARAARSDAALRRPGAARGAGLGAGAAAAVPDPRRAHQRARPGRARARRRRAGPGRAPRPAPASCSSSTRRTCWPGSPTRSSFWTAGRWPGGAGGSVLADPRLASWASSRRPRCGWSAICAAGSRRPVAALDEPPGAAKARLRHRGRAASTVRVGCAVVRPSIELDGVSFAYPDGTRALDRRRPSDRARRDGGDRRPERLGQVHAGPAPERAAPTDGRARAARRRRHARGSTWPRWPARVGLAFQNPDRQLFAGRVSGRGGVRAAQPGRARRRARGAGRGGAGGGRSRRRRPSPTRTTWATRAASCWRSPPCWRCGRRSWSWTSRRRARTPGAWPGCRAVVEAAAAEGRTVIAISHDMRFVAECFGRVIVMRAGRVVLDGPPAEVFGEAAWPELRASSSSRPTPRRRRARARARARPPTDGRLGRPRAWRTDPAPRGLRGRPARRSVARTASLRGDARTRPQPRLQLAQVERHRDGRDSGRPRRTAWSAAVSAEALEPLAQIAVDWGVDATEGADPADDIRALLARYEAAGISAASLGGGRISRRPRRRPRSGSRPS